VLPVALPDGSSVLLQPHSSISYSEVFNEARREVRLSGQAFFEVMKDTARPFYVYSGEMVTKVLGTSFTVSAFEEASSFSVVVKTGKVSVFAQKGKQAGEESPAAAIDLTPFQQAVFDREELSFTRSQIRPSGLAVLAPSAINFYEFDDTPAPEVFRRLGKAYGVLIELDEQLLSDCALTTTLSDEPLFEKMAILCQAIGPGTSFVLEDDRIRIRSKGCNQ